jgi:hypothetical protein
MGGGQCQSMSISHSIMHGFLPSPKSIILLLVECGVEISLIHSSMLLSLVYPSRLAFNIEKRRSKKSYMISLSLSIMDCYIPAQGTRKCKFRLMGKEESEPG